jgi:hypothetical protein
VSALAESSARGPLGVDPKLFTQQCPAPAFDNARDAIDVSSVLLDVCEVCHDSDGLTAGGQVVLRWRQLGPMKDRAVDVCLVQGDVDREAGMNSAGQLEPRFFRRMFSLATALQNTRSLLWDIPSNLPPGPHYKILVEETQGSVKDLSAPFSIHAATSADPTVFRGEPIIRTSVDFHTDTAYHQYIRDRLTALLNTRHANDSPVRVVLRAGNTQYPSNFTGLSPEPGMQGTFLGWTRFSPEMRVLWAGADSEFEYPVHWHDIDVISGRPSVAANPPAPHCADVSVTIGLDTSSTHIPSGEASSSTVSLDAQPESQLEGAAAAAAAAASQASASAPVLPPSATDQFAQISSVSDPVQVQPDTGKAESSSLSQVHAQSNTAEEPLQPPERVSGVSEASSTPEQEPAELKELFMANNNTSFNSNAGETLERPTADGAVPPASTPLESFHAEIRHDKMENGIGTPTPNGPSSTLPGSTAKAGNCDEKGATDQSSVRSTAAPASLPSLKPALSSLPVPRYRCVHHPNGHDVFISFRPSDGNALAATLQRLLHERGRSVRFDHKCLVYGDLRDQLNFYAETTPVFMPVLTKGFLHASRLNREDDPCRLDLIAAISAGRVVLPVVEEGYKAWRQDAMCINHEAIRAALLKTNTAKFVHCQPEACGARIDRLVQTLLDRYAIGNPPPLPVPGPAGSAAGISAQAVLRPSPYSPGEPAIEVVEPLENARLCMGQPMKIVWHSVEVQRVNIHLQKRSATEDHWDLVAIVCEKLVSSSIGSNTNEWTIPALAVGPCDAARLVVQSCEDASVRDQSCIFSIADTNAATPPASVTAVLGGRSRLSTSSTLVLASTASPSSAQTPTSPAVVAKPLSLTHAPPPVAAVSRAVATNSVAPSTRNASSSRAAAAAAAAAAAEARAAMAKDGRVSLLQSLRGTGATNGTLASSGASMTATNEVLIALKDGHEPAPAAATNHGQPGSAPVDQDRQAPSAEKALVDLQESKQADISNQRWGEDHTVLRLPARSVFMESAGLSPGNSANSAPNPTATQVKAALATAAEDNGASVKAAASPDGTPLIRAVFENDDSSAIATKVAGLVAADLPRADLPEDKNMEQAQVRQVFSKDRPSAAATKLLEETPFCHPIELSAALAPPAAPSVLSEDRLRKALQYQSDATAANLALSRAETLAPETSLNTAARKSDACGEGLAPPQIGLEHKKLAADEQASTDAVNCVLVAPESAPVQPTANVVPVVSRSQVANAINETSALTADSATPKPVGISASSASSPPSVAPGPVPTQRNDDVTKCEIMSQRTHTYNTIDRGTAAGQPPREGGTMKLIKGLPQTTHCKPPLLSPPRTPLSPVGLPVDPRRDPKSCAQDMSSFTLLQKLNTPTLSGQSSSNHMPLSSPASGQAEADRRPRSPSQSVYDEPASLNPSAPQAPAVSAPSGQAPTLALASGAGLISRPSQSSVLATSAPVPTSASVVTLGPASSQAPATQNLGRRAAQDALSAAAAPVASHGPASNHPLVSKQDPASNHPLVSKQDPASNQAPVPNVSRASSLSESGHSVAPGLAASPSAATQSETQVPAKNAHGSFVLDVVLGPAASAGVSASHAPAAPSLSGLAVATGPNARSPTAAVPSPGTAGPAATANACMSPALFAVQTPMVAGPVASTITAQHAPSLLPSPYPGTFSLSSTPTNITAHRSVAAAGLATAPATTAGTSASAAAFLSPPAFCSPHSLSAFPSLRSHSSAAASNMADHRSPVGYSAVPGQQSSHPRPPQHLGSPLAALPLSTHNLIVHGALGSGSPASSASSPSQGGAREHVEIIVVFVLPGPSGHPMKRPFSLFVPDTTLAGIRGDIVDLWQSECEEAGLPGHHFCYLHRMPLPPSRSSSSMPSPIGNGLSPTHHPSPKTGQIALPGPAADTPSEHGQSASLHSSPMSSLSRNSFGFVRNGLAKVEHKHEGQFALARIPPVLVAGGKQVRELHVRMCEMGCSML